VSIRFLVPGGVFLAWAQLRFEGRRLLAALAGIIFVTMSAQFQTGVYSAFFDSSVALIGKFNADLVMVSSNYRSVTVHGSFPEDRLFQVLGEEGVESVNRLALASAFCTSLDKHNLQESLLIGVSPSEAALTFKNNAEYLDRLKSAETVLFDRESADAYGPIVERFGSEGAFYMELSQQRVRMGGLFELGPSFALPGNFMTALENFYRLAPLYRKGNISCGLIRLKEGQNADEIVERLNKRLPADVRVETLQQRIKEEKLYWNEFTPIGFIIPVSLIVSLIVGGVVVYQILYTSVNDHIKEYATLKAIGYTNLSLGGIVLQQAILLTLIGFPLGLCFSYGLFHVAKEATGLPFELAWQQIALCGGLTAVMSFFSGLFALGKLSQADPADVFA